MKPPLCTYLTAISIAFLGAPSIPTLVRDPLPELVDSVKVRDARSELEHNVQGERTHTGDWSGRNHRYAEDGGWFTYDMRVDTKTPLVLQCDYWGGDVRYFQILVEGELIADVKLENPHPGRFYTESYPIPRSTIAGRRRVVVCFKPHPKSIAGGIYGVVIRRR